MNGRHDSRAPFADRLLEWWDEHGRKDLPWQHPRTPYRVWVSEIMLQQTQVTTVIPFFERWMKRFPDLNTLAQSELDDVLSLWSGLGYYARARNLHKTAIVCQQDHAGELPVTAEELTALPGIGLSTANAIISQSTDRPAAVLDGNVRRLLARHQAVGGWPGKSAVQKELWAIAEKRLPTKRGADYTQAVMDLGATLCTRTKPTCLLCPVQADCLALRNQQVDRYPFPKPATKVGRMDMYMLVIRDDKGRVLLHRRPPVGIWGGLWSLPTAPDQQELENQLGLENTRPDLMEAFEHRLSHRIINIQPALATSVNATQVKCGPDHQWIDPADHEAVGLPRPVADILKNLNSGERT